MIRNDELLNPKSAFPKAKEAYMQKAAEFFDSLVEKSGIDTAKNAATMQKYKEKNEDNQSEKKKLSKQKGLMGLLIAGIIICLIAAIVFIILGAVNTIPLPVGIIVGAVFAGLMIFLIVIGIRGPGKKIKSLKSNLSEIQKELDALKQQGYTECYALNSILDYDMQIGIFNSVFDDIKLHRAFEPEQFEYFHEKFGLNENDKNDHSTVHVQSGEILGNPLLVETAKIMVIGPCTYQGSKVVTYTVSEPDGKGGSTTRTVTETLRATVTKPKPYYNYEKVIYYGNEAAPKLSFSRVPVGLNKKNEKEQASYVKSEYKKVQSFAKKNMKNGFTPLANEEFETMFHAWDRDNEVEFRMMFTPLAQRNFVDLLKNNKPFGDDFIFKKTKMLNAVRNEHNQVVDYVGYPTDFEDFSYEASKEKFLKWNEKYFTSFYFDLAPFMSIPLYMQNPASKYENSQKYPGIATNFEVEALVSTLGSQELVPPECATEVIFKSRITSHNKSLQRCEITSHGFSAHERIDFVPVTAGNGRVYDVPVPWIEYLPLEEKSNVLVMKKEMSRYEYNQLRNSEKYQNFVKKYNIKADQINFCDDFFIVYNGNSVNFSDEDIEDLIA